MFKLNYFDQPACLAQSPQLYKQMACACGGLDRLVIIGALYLCCAVLYCTVLYCTVLYCTVLYFTVLYCAVLCYAAISCHIIHAMYNVM